MPKQTYFTAGLAERTARIEELMKEGNELMADTSILPGKWYAEPTCGCSSTPALMWARWYREHVSNLSH